MSHNLNDSTAYRKEKKRRSNLHKLLAIAVAILGIFLIWTFRGVMFEPFRGIVSRINPRTGGEGFPIVLSGSAGYAMNLFDSNFLLLSDTYLYTYNYRGGQMLAHRHHYNAPRQRSTNRRILLYNFNAHEFSLFSRTGRVYEVKLDERIILAELGSSDMVAAVTVSAAFSNRLHIYDRSGRRRYTRWFTDEEVNAVAFTSKNNEIIAATSTVRNGDVISKIYRLRTDTEDDLIWERELPFGAWALQVSENGNYITVLADNAVMSFNSSDGEPAGSYRFDAGRLVKDVYGTEFNLIELRDYATGKTLFVTLDAQSNLIKSEIMPFEAKQVEISGGIVYTLTGGTIEKHDMFLNPVGVTELGDEYRGFIIAGNYALLLGYETIERFALE
ncbi:MAG: DUF5711 family protein [Oscillospiraceae bacterium]|jgi:hypothetical protein|nr:DUF5711 family protein [Oscillospiraceae bacterium]